MEIDKIEERVAHLRKLVSRIESSERYEYDFDRLYKLLNEEYELEGGKNAPYVMGNYRHNLEQTIWKQADTYIRTKKRRKVKGAPSEYGDFIRHFKQDVTDELRRFEYMLNSSAFS